MTMADTVAVMNAGQIEQLGAPVELYESPVTTFVANFLGQSNLLQVTRTGEGHTVAVDCHGQALGIPSGRVATGSRTFLAGVRPEKIHLVDAGAAPGGGSNVLRGGIVVDASFTGVSTQYLVRMPWGQSLTVFSQNLGVGERYRTGDPVDLTWDPAHTFGLDGDARAGAQVDDGALSVGVG